MPRQSEPDKKWLEWLRKRREAENDAVDNAVDDLSRQAPKSSRKNGPVPAWVSWSPPPPQLPPEPNGDGGRPPRSPNAVDEHAGQERGETPANLPSPPARWRHPDIRNLLKGILKGSYRFKDIPFGLGNMIPGNMGIGRETIFNHGLVPAARDLALSIGVSTRKGEPYYSGDEVARLMEIKEDSPPPHRAGAFRSKAVKPEKPVKPGTEKSQDTARRRMPDDDDATPAQRAGVAVTVDAFGKGTEARGTGEDKDENDRRDAGGDDTVDSAEDAGNGLGAEIDKAISDEADRSAAEAGAKRRLLASSGRVAAFAASAALAALLLRKAMKRRAASKEKRGRVEKRAQAQARVQTAAPSKVNTGMAYWAAMRLLPWLADVQRMASVNTRDDYKAFNRDMYKHLQNMAHGIGSRMYDYDPKKEDVYGGRVAELFGGVYDRPFAHPLDIRPYYSQIASPFSIDFMHRATPSPGNKYFDPRMAFLEYIAGTMRNPYGIVTDGTGRVLAYNSGTLTPSIDPDSKDNYVSRGLDPPPKFFTRDDQVLNDILSRRDYAKLLPGAQWMGYAMPALVGAEPWWDYDAGAGTPAWTNAVESAAHHTTAAMHGDPMFGHWLDNEKGQGSLDDRFLEDYLPALADEKVGRNEYEAMRKALLDFGDAVGPHLQRDTVAGPHLVLGQNGILGTAASVADAYWDERDRDLGSGISANADAATKGGASKAGAGILGSLFGGGR